MTINISAQFEKIDTKLNDLLSKYKGLRFIGFDQSNENKPYYLNEEITKGFYYKTKKTPVTGQVVERLKMVVSNDELQDAVNKAKLIELMEEDGETFTRFTFETEKEPEPPTFEYVFLIVPNKQDKGIIT